MIQENLGESWQVASPCITFWGSAASIDIQGLVNEIRARGVTGHSTEHKLRPALSRLFVSIDGNGSLFQWFL